MAVPGHQAALLDAGSAHPRLIPVLARHLAAAGMGVKVDSHQDTCELTVLGMASGKSFLALNADGRARWYYEPAAGPSTSPATLTAIIAYLLGAPQDTTTPAAYRAFPLKGQVGRALQDRGLTVVLRVSEDLESFEATTDIDVTSPARPWLGTITLSDDAAVDWRLDVRAAFRGNPATLIDLIIPILRPQRHGPPRLPCPIPPARIWPPGRFSRCQHSSP